MGCAKRLWVTLVPLVGVALSCSDDGGSSELPIGTIDSLSEAACQSLSQTPGTMASALDKEAAVANASMGADEPMTVTLAGPVSYIALQVPTHHTDYGIFVHPPGSVVATSATTLPEEHLDGSCPNDDLGELRVHIHEVDYGVLTLEGARDGEVWVYFGAAGPPGHGGAGGHGGDDHGDGGHGGDDHAHGGHGGDDHI